MHQRCRNRGDKNSLMDLLENQCVNPYLPLRVPFAALTHSFAAKLGLSSVSSLQTRPAVERFVCHPLSLRLSLLISMCLIRSTPSNAPPFSPSFSLSPSLSYLVDQFHLPSLSLSLVTHGKDQSSAPSACSLQCTALSLIVLQNGDYVQVNEMSGPASPPPHLHPLPTTLSLSFWAI
jgi:hypothetical protein